MMNEQNRQNEKSALFSEITEISFAMDELRLYLDTHPQSAEALALFTEYQDKRHALVAEYTEKYGAIYSYKINTENGWSWAAAPMPWETEAN